jgi:3-phenylpropionate/cinnamic acid dioxygenase small subunit
MALSIDDRLALNELYARYAYAFDGGDADEWCALFTPGGSFVLPDGSAVTGTAALRQFVVDRTGEAPGMRHLIANILLDENADGARGRAYFLAFRLGGDGKFRLRNFGRYEDEFVRSGGAWRISSRRVVAELPLELVDAPFQF